MKYNKNQEIIFQSKYSISGYFGIILYLITIGIILNNIILNDFSVWAGLGFFAFAAFFIDIFFGDSGRIRLMNNKILVEYFFPWRRNKNFSFNRIISIETRSIAFRRLLNREVHMEDDINGKYSFKIQTFCGLFRDIDDFKLIVKSKYGISD